MQRAAQRTGIAIAAALLCAGCGETPDPAEDAVSAIERRQRRELLIREIATLGARQRAALALSYAAGLSNAEAAEVLEISVGAVEALLVRARRKLRQRLSGRLEG